MSQRFLLYGSTGFVGDAIARLAVQQGLAPILAGRDPVKVQALASELGLDHRVFALDDVPAIDRALAEVDVVLHCAGPYIHTYQLIMEGCLRTHTHYLDLTGEIQVYQALAARDADAKERKVMLLPGVGFDVVPTDCLALYLKQRLPSATHLTLAFHSRGPAGLPPGTVNTMVETIPLDKFVRRDGHLVPFPDQPKMRLIDFGQGPVQATLIPWGDVFTAYYSTRIPTIEDYIVLPPGASSPMSSLRFLSPLFKLAAVRRFVRRQIKSGSTAEERAATHTHVWGEVEDDQGKKAVARMHGPEAGVVWTARAALTAVRRVLAGDAPPGYATPALAYGADFALESEGVTREDIM
jgi:short subunit dehydrogenase-like uncharacterized protein